MNAIIWRIKNKFKRWFTSIAIFVFYVWMPNEMNDATHAYKYALDKAKKENASKKSYRIMSIRWNPIKFVSKFIVLSTVSLFRRKRRAEWMPPQHESIVIVRCYGSCQPSDWATWRYFPLCHIATTKWKEVKFHLTRRQQQHQQRRTYRCSTTRSAHTLHPNYIRFAFVA